MRWKVLAIVGLVTIAGGAVGVSLGAFNPTASSATTLLTAQASVTDVTDEVAATGTLESTEQVALGFGREAWSADVTADASSPSTGVTWPVETVGVAVGDVVAAGDELASADTVDLESQIADATRSAKSAAIQLRQAQATLDDAEAGAARRQARIALYNAESAAARADSDLAALQAARAYATLVAPIAGVVVDVAIRAGEDASAGAAITIASQTLVVATSVVEADIASIQVGQAATVSVDAVDAVLDGTVTAIAPAATSSGNSGVVSFAVTVALDSAPAGLRPGMSADVTIVTATASGVLAVPSRALSGSGGNYTVRVVAQDGSVEIRSVRVGLVTSSLAEITSGLDAGEAVVTGTSTSQTTGPGGGIRGGGAFPGGGFIGR